MHGFEDDRSTKENAFPRLEDGATGIAYVSTSVDERRTKERGDTPNATRILNGASRPGSGTARAQSFFSPLKGPGKR